MRSVLTSFRAWTPLFEETISRLGEFAAGERVDPAVVVAIRAALWWHAQYSETAAQDSGRSRVGAPFRNSPMQPCPSLA